MRRFRSPSIEAEYSTGVKKMAYVRNTSTRYLTSRKKRLAEERINAPATVNPMSSTSIGSAHRACHVGCQPVKKSSTSTMTLATRKSNRFEKLAEIGKTSLGKAIFVTRLEF